MCYMMCNPKLCNKTHIQLKNIFSSYLTRGVGSSVVRYDTRYDSPKSIVKVSEVKWSEWVSEVKWSNFWVFKISGTFICYRGCLNLNCYIAKKVQKNFLMGLKIWWSWGSTIFFSKSPWLGRFSIFMENFSFYGDGCSFWAKKWSFAWKIENSPTFGDFEKKNCRPPTSPNF